MHSDPGLSQFPLLSSPHTTVSFGPRALLAIVNPDAAANSIAAIGSDDTTFTVVLFIVHLIFVFLCLFHSTAITGISMTNPNNSHTKLFRLFG